jgi:uncharacterized short protein YbdD (DUF466 family)
MLRADTVRGCWRILVQAARLAVGVPDYDAYVAHMRARHPEREPMDRAAFFAERMQARYGRGRSRCC